MAKTSADFLGLRWKLFLGFTLGFTVLMAGAGYWALHWLDRRAAGQADADHTLLLIMALIYAGGLALIAIAASATLTPIRQLLRAAQTTGPGDPALPDFERLAHRRLPDEVSVLARIFWERQQAQTALRDSEQKLNSLLEHSHDGFMMVDEAGQIIEWNPRMEALTGIPQARALGHPADEIQALMSPGLDRKRTTQVLANALREGAFPTGSTPYKWRLRQPNGEERFIEDNPFVIPVGSRFMIGSISRDITERSRAEQQIQQLNTELEQHVRERTAELESTIAQLHQEAAERHRVEAALRDSEVNYRTLVETSPDAIARIDLSGRVLMANAQTYTLFDYPESGRTGHENAFDFIAPQDHARAAANLQSLLATRRQSPVEYTLQRQDKTPFAGELSTSLISDPAGQPQGFITVMRDISERKAAETLLLRRQSTLELLHRAGQAFSSTLHLDQVLNTILDEVRRRMDAVACSIWLTDPATGDTVCRQATGPQSDVVRGWRVPKGEGIVGWVIAYGRGVNLADIQSDLRYYTEVDLKTHLPLRSMLAVPLRGRQSTLGVLEVGDLQVGHFTADDLTFLELLAITAVSAIENAALYEQAQHEIAERSRAEETLNAANQRLQTVSRQLVEVQETERRQLALELHDELGQMLNSIKLSLDMVPTNAVVDSQPADETQESLRRAKRLISQLIQQVRQLALDLRPAMLDDLGLVPALKSLFHRHTSQTGLQVNFNNGVSANRRFPPSIETAAYRIIQQGVTNAARHANVQHVSVEVQVDGQALCLTVRDQGRGFDPAALLAEPASTGLGGMRERAHLLGGTLIIESAPGAGTRLRASLPLT